MSAPDDERRVDLFDDDLEILPDTTSDERGGWGERADDGEDDIRLLAERPPHWS